MTKRCQGRTLNDHDPESDSGSSENACFSFEVYRYSEMDKCSSTSSTFQDLECGALVKVAAGIFRSADTVLRM